MLSFLAGKSLLLEVVLWVSSNFHWFPSLKDHLNELLTNKSIRKTLIFIFLNKVYYTQCIMVLYSG